MRDATRIRLLGTFDREPFIGSILRTGLILSALCIGGAVAWQSATSTLRHFAGPIQGTNVADLLLDSLTRIRSLHEWPDVLLDIGIASLLLAPYARVLASWWYFAAIERNRRYAFFTGIVSLILTYVLFFG